MDKDIKNILILENIIFSKRPKTEFNKWYKRQYFNKFIKKILPEINDCICQQQKSVWHLYNVFEHTLLALRKANKLSQNYSNFERKVISFSVFFHDLGKPYTLVEKVDKNGNIYHGFPNHNVKSVEIFNRVKNLFNLTKLEQKLIENLILNHDSFNYVERVINKDFYIEKYNEIVKIVGENKVKTYFKSLVVIAKSDNFAQNRVKTKATLNKIRAFEKLIK